MNNGFNTKVRFKLCSKKHDTICGGLCFIGAIILFIIGISIYINISQGKAGYFGDFFVANASVLIGIILIVLGYEAISASDAEAVICSEGIYYKCCFHKVQLIEWKDIQKVVISDTPFSDGSHFCFKRRIICYLYSGKKNIIGMNKQDTLYFEYSEALNDIFLQYCPFGLSDDTIRIDGVDAEVWCKSISG